MVGVAAFAGVVGGVGGLGGRGRWVERGAPVAASKVLVAPSSDAAMTTRRGAGDADDAAFPLRGGVLGGCSPASHARNAAVREHRPAAHRRSARTASRKAARQSTRDAARGAGRRRPPARPRSRGEERAPEVRGGGGRAPRRARGRGARGGAESRGEAHALDASNGRSSHGAPRASTTTREAVAGGDPSGLGPVGSAKGAGRRARAARGRAGPPGVVARGRRRAPGRGRGRRRRRRGRRRRGLRGSLDADVRPPPGRVSTFERRFARIAALSRALLLLILPAVLPPGKAREHRGHAARPDERAHRAQRAHVRVGAARRDVGRATRTRSSASETQKKKARSARASDIFRARRNTTRVWLARQEHPRVMGRQAARRNAPPGTPVLWDDDERSPAGAPAHHFRPRLAPSTSRTRAAMSAMSALMTLPSRAPAAAAAPRPRFSPGARRR